MPRRSIDDLHANFKRAQFSSLKRNSLGTIFEKPKSSWKYNTKSSTLTYTIRSHVHDVEKLKEVTKSSPLLNYQHAEETNLDVLQSKDIQKLSCKGDSLYGNNISFIHHDKQGLLFLDHNVKSYLQLKPELVNKFNKNSESNVEIINSTNCTYNGKQVTKVELQSGENSKVRLLLWLWDDKETSQYRESVFKLLMGCNCEKQSHNKVLDKLLSLGIPIKGESFLHLKEKPVSEFFIEDFKIINTESEFFNIPKGYKDIRSIEKNKEKSSYKVPLHQIRNNRFASTASLTEPAITAGGEELQHNNYSLTSNNNYQPTNSCLSSTYGSKVALSGEQQLANDIKLIVNAISKRLSSFSGSNGNLKIKWLEQFKQYSDNASQGDGLYCFLRNDSMDADALNNPGLLDIFVQRKLVKMLSRLDITDISPHVMVSDVFVINNSFTIPRVLAEKVIDVISNTAIQPDNRFNSLSAQEKLELIKAYLFQVFGQISLSYPSSTEEQRIFHDFIDVKLDNIDFEINLNNTPIIDALTVGNNSIHTVIKLPGASGKAHLTRKASNTYYFVSAAIIIGCTLFPIGVCSLYPYIVIVGAFLALDSADVDLTLSDLIINAQINYVPNFNGILQPSSRVNIETEVEFKYESNYYTGLHQIVALILSLVGTHLDEVITTLEEQLQNKLNFLLNDTLNISFPMSFGELPLTCINTATGGIPEDYIYLEAEINSGVLGTINPHITEVDSHIRSKMRSYATNFKEIYGNSVHHYASFVINQNFLNHYIHTNWRQGAFNYVLSPSEQVSIIEMFREIYHDYPFTDETLIKLHSAVSPRLILNNSEKACHNNYLTAFFDDMRLCIKTKNKDGKGYCVLEIQFSAKVNAEIGFGKKNTLTNLLDITKYNGQLFNLYYALDNSGIELTHSELISHNETGPCFKNLNCSELSRLSPALTKAMYAYLNHNNSNCIPRENADPLTIQNYEFASQSLLFKFDIHRGNLYGHIGFGGTLLLLLSGLIDLDELSCQDGTLLRVFIDPE